MAYNTKHTAEQIDALLGEVFDSTLQTKEIEITQSGTTEIVADADFLALKKVNLNVNVQGGGGSVEYLDVSGLDNDLQTMLLSYSAMVRAIVDGAIYIIPSINAYQQNIATSKIKAVGVAWEQSVYMSVSGMPKMTIKEVLTMMTNIDSLPRLTKEEFYAI